MICSECGLVVGDRVIDVGSEWRTFSNDKGGEDRSRVGGPENSLLGGSDLTTMIGPARFDLGQVVVKGRQSVSALIYRGGASFDAEGNSAYSNRRNISSSDRTLIATFRTISNMADRINLTRTITDRANA